ncbi:hypothetical protein LSAT2_014035, partial [Lamellibrachia satsuma]
MKQLFFAGCQLSHVAARLAAPTQQGWLHQHSKAGCTNTARLAAPTQQGWLHPHSKAGCTNTAK